MNDIYNLLLYQKPQPAGIPESVLDRWATQGATATAQSTHERVRRIVLNYDWKSFKPEIYLQGSYRNSTNIRGDSDVDIVVEWDVLQLPASTDRLTLFRACKTLVEALLKERFEKVDCSDKCIKVARTSNTIPADVVPAFTFRRSGQLLLIPPAVGMTFFNATSQQWVTNFPKQHIQNGMAKNSATSQAFKETVRMFKNALSWAGFDFPGYFIECLLYNVPDDKFAFSGRDLLLGASETQLRRRYLAIINWLQISQLESFWCQNHETLLFGSGATQWETEKARTVIAAWKYIWDTYQ